MADRLDRAPWNPIHTRIAAALGVGWALDAFEVQIIGSVIPSIAQEWQLSHAQQVAVFVVWFAGIGVGAAGFGVLADRVGRKRLFVATLLLYSLAAMATAASPNYGVFIAFRFLTGLGVGGEYSAVASAIAEFVPARLRGRTNAAVMNMWSVGGIVAGLVGSCSCPRRWARAAGASPCCSARSAPRTPCTPGGSSPSRRAGSPPGAGRARRT